MPVTGWGLVSMAACRHDHPGLHAAATQLPRKTIYGRPLLTTLGLPTPLGPSLLSSLPRSPPLLMPLCPLPSFPPSPPSQPSPHCL